MFGIRIKERRKPEFEEIEIPEGLAERIKLLRTLEGKKVLAVNVFERKGRTKTYLAKGVLKTIEEKHNLDGTITNIDLTKRQPSEYLVEGFLNNYCYIEHLRELRVEKLF